MDSKVKVKLTRIGKTERFKNTFEKLSVNNDLSYDEKSYILATAILFLRHYEKDKRYRTYADIAYYIILKYSYTYRDYEPLYDFSINFGFFPIVQKLLMEELYEEDQLVNLILSYRINEFRNSSDYYETLEQNLQSKKFLDDQSNEKAYLAPTSFGKSSIIIDYIKNNLNAFENVVVVVPTKSLLMQTYRMIRDADIQRRVIIHDEMYNDDENFVAIFTQERALRLTSRKNVVFDSLIIDEAHNILKKDSGSRQILLTRLIKRNLKNNTNQKVIYLGRFLCRLAIFESLNVLQYKLCLLC